MAEKKTWKDFGGAKNSTIRARMDDDTVRKLDICCDKLHTTRSDVLRKGIERIYDDLDLSEK